MHTIISRDNLLRWLSYQAPETNRFFMVLPDQNNLSMVISTLFDLTMAQIKKRKSGRLSRYLFIAEVLLTNGDHQIRYAVRTTYMYRLATVLYKKDSQSVAIFQQLPPALRSEYETNNYPDE